MADGDERLSVGPRPTRTDHGRFLLAVILVAVLAAVFALAFRTSLTWLYRSLYGQDTVVDAIAALPPWLRFAAPVGGALLAGLISRTRFGRSQNVSNVMEAVALGRVRLSLRVTASRVASSWAAIAGGMSIGREGPLIETGGALGAGIGPRLRLPAEHTRVLVAVGTAAGFAAAYHTPFAAALFVLETIAGIAAPMLVLPVMAGSVAALAITQAAMGSAPIYGQRGFGIDSPVDLLWVLALGVAASLSAIGFKAVLGSVEGWFDRHPVPQPARAMIGGVVVGTIAVWLPAVAGNGYEPINGLLDAPPPIGVLALLAVAKVVATTASLGAGVPGGIFTPMLLVGATVGAASSLGLAAAGLGPHSTGGFALVGMAATTAASTHAPLTAAVMLVELSGDYALALPLLAATVVSTSVSLALGSESVYEAELRKRGIGWDLTLEGRRMRDGGGTDGWKT